MRNKTLKYALLFISGGIALLASSISGCLPDPYSIGEPDSLFSEYVLVWDLVDRHYACFFANENVDWDQVYQILKPEAENLQNRDQLKDICLELMSSMMDQNLILRDSAGTRLDSWSEGDFLNWDLTVWMDYMQEWFQVFHMDLEAYGATVINIISTEKVGYVYLSDLGNGFNMVEFYSATNAVADCSGIILDLRMCGESGFEINAHYASGRFVENLALSYYRAFRVGPGRNDMGELDEVWAHKNGAWQFTNPIIILTGRFTQGAGEQLVLFLRSQEHVTVIGDTTAGFANPAVSFNLTEGWSIEIPSMVTYSLGGTLLMNSGIAPDILIEVSEADFAAGVDPVLDAALEMVVR
ncbi:MAG: hypothetical protein KAW14_08675 [Candidatus Aegiribacteria sp.]|nr:hypothetical protein [Candidatus Aegiribacteria sp.]